MVPQQFLRVLDEHLRIIELLIERARDPLVTIIRKLPPSVKRVIYNVLTTERVSGFIVARLFANNYSIYRRTYGQFESYLDRTYFPGVADFYAIYLLHKIGQD